MFNPIQTNTLSASNKIKNMLWGAINASIFRWSPSHFSIFRKFRVALLRLFGANINWSASVHPSAKIEYPWNISMGEISSIGEKTWIYAMAPIIIGSKTCIGKDCYLITGTHDTKSNSFDLVTRPITIGNACWITTRVTILPGVNIGHYSIVGANSTVTHNVEPWTIVGGNPAKPIKKRILRDG